MREGHSAVTAAVMLLCQSFNACTASDPMLFSSSQHHIQYLETRRNLSLNSRELEDESLREEVRASSELELNKRSGPIYGRRHPDASPIDYGGTHPYEIMDRRRKLATAKRSDDNRRSMLSKPSWYDPAFAVDDYVGKDGYDTDDTYNPEFDPLPPDPSKDEKFNWKNFKPIRIRFDPRHLEEYSLDEAKDEFILYHVLPVAIQFWTKALMVYPTKRLFVDENVSCN